MRPDPVSLARKVRSRLRRAIRSAGPAAPPGAPAVLGLSDIAELRRDSVEAASRALASPVYLGDGVALCRLLTRYKFFVAADDVGFGANVLLDGFWEFWLTRFIARNVPRGGTVVDVGANFGYYSMLLADLVGPEGRLYAVEPNPAAAGLLRRALSLNGFAGRTELCEAAAGASDGTSAKLFVPAGEPKNAALVAAAPERAGELRQVPVRSLDALLAAEDRIDFVKIDAEGGEEAIIDGMARILAERPPPMVLEFNAARYADPRAFLDRLLRHYGSLRHVDFDGAAAAVSPERVLSENVGEDWLLFLSRS